jgi:selenium-binding protein 1
VVNVEDLSASVWLWNREGEDFVVRKVITIPAEPAQTEDLPPALQPFGAVPPFITDIDLSVDDQWLYVSTWGTGDLHQYDVSDPFHPRQTASVRLGGIVSRQPHPVEPDTPLTGGAQMVELSRDGRRVYLTNSLYGTWDAQFYPAGIDPWMVKLDADTSHGGLSVDSRFYPHGPDFLGLRVHQTRLQGGDASSDSYCYRS